MTHDEREEERRLRAARLVVAPRGRGFVELSFEQGNGKMLNETSVVLQYPQSGTLVGEPPIDVQNAHILQDAAQALNDALLRLCS